MIIFDFDGTLADTISLGLTLFNSYSEKFNYNKISREENADLSAVELLKLSGIKFWKLPYIVWFFRNRLHEHSSDIKMISGIKEMLSRLKQDGQELGILTSNSENTVRDFLQRNQIEQYFTFFRTKVPVFGKKQALRKAKRQLKSDFVYVGDELRDIEACRKTGTQIVSVAWGFNSAASLEKANPGLVAKSTDQAYTLITGEAKKL